DRSAQRVLPEVSISAGRGDGDQVFAGRNAGLKRLAQAGRRRALDHVAERVAEGECRVEHAAEHGGDREVEEPVTHVDDEGVDVGSLLDDARGADGGPTARGDVSGGEERSAVIVRAVTETVGREVGD